MKVDAYIGVYDDDGKKLVTCARDFPPNTYDWNKEIGIGIVIANLLQSLSVDGYEPSLVAASIVQLLVDEARDGNRREPEEIRKAMEEMRIVADHIEAVWTKKHDDIMRLMAR